MLAYFPGKDKEQLYSESAACESCGVSVPELSTQLFSFNNPQGACPECSGLGVRQFFDPQLVVPDLSLSLSDGAIAAWGTRSLSSYSGQMLASLAVHYGFDLDVPFRKLSSRIQNIILYGSGKETIVFRYRKGRRKIVSQVVFEGVLP